MQAPQLPHLKAIKRIWRYLSGTKDFGILFAKGEELVLMGHVDSDYASDIKNGRSTTGFIF